MGKNKALKEIYGYCLEMCEKMTYYEMVEFIANEIYRHENTIKELKTTSKKLESSRKAVKRLKNKGE